MSIAPGLPPPRLRQSMLWLRNHDVDSRAIGDAFGCTPNHVRQLIYRARHDEVRLERLNTDTIDVPSDTSFEWEDEAVPPASKRVLDSVVEEIAQARRRFGAEFR